MKKYRVQNGQGLFCRGGHVPRFDKTGKTWNRLAHVLVFLKGLRNFPPNDWRIVEYDMVETQVLDPQGLLMDREIEKEEQARRKDEAKTRALEAHARQLYEALKKKFEGT